MRRSVWLWLGLLAAAVVAIAGARGWLTPGVRDFATWAGGNRAARAALVTVQRVACPGAPFVLPADGWVGLLYADPRGPYSALRRHQGIDIFVDRDLPLGTQPVYAVADGYITRERDWVATLIQRIPSNPLNPDEQIWVYYTHMADEAGNDFIVDAFERGTYQQFVTQGTLLGYIGSYDGNVPSQIWPHLHLSIVRDAGGRYLNEAEIANTLDPSPFFGMPMHYAGRSGGALACLP